MPRAAQKRRSLDGSFNYWLQTHPRTKPFSPRTVQSYTDQAKLFQRWLEENGIAPEKVTEEDIFDHFADLAAEGKAPASISLRHAAIKKLYEFLEQRGLASENPARDIPFRIAQTNSGQPYTQNEVRRMYQACRSWWEQAVFMLLLGTGLRRSEVFRVSRDDCNFENGTIRVLRKGGQYQYIMPEPAVMHAVEVALQFNDRLCWQKWDDCIVRLIKKLAARAGIPGRHHPHRLRFTFAVQWCESGGQESELMMAMGHTSPRMTAYYSKVGRERRAMQAMATLGIASRMLGPVP